MPKTKAEPTLDELLADQFPELSDMQRKPGDVTIDDLIARGASYNKARRMLNAKVQNEGWTVRSINYRGERINAYRPPERSK